MIENLTAQDVANQISMLRSSFKGTFVVVEGVTDSRLYDKFVDRGNARTVIAYSKDNVRRAVLMLKDRGDERTIGIMDSDLDRMEGKTWSSPLFLTDKRDLESMIMSSNAFSDVMSEYADPESLRKFEEKYGDIRDVVAKAAYPVGLLMFISKRDGLGMCFKDLNHRQFISGKSLAIDVRRMINEALAGSRGVPVSVKMLEDKIQQEEELLNDPWYAIRGHDAVAVLCIGVNEIFGAYNGRGMKDGQLSGALRLAYSADDFRDTDVFAATDAWSAKTGNPLWFIP